MKSTFDILSKKTSKLVTNQYSTSFSLGIFMLDRKIHEPIYAIYGYVRLADEIVDSFHGYDKVRLLAELKKDTYGAIDAGISVNPILNSFQEVVNRYHIERSLIDTFLKSMEMDLDKRKYSAVEYQQYILGSAEVVGLMCLRVFTDGSQQYYEQLKPYAMRLGAAFQKVNFLRDFQDDYEGLGRSYFPGIYFDNFDEHQKRNIEKEIQEDFRQALIGIRQLPRAARLGVYTAYVYYSALFQKIKAVSASRIMQERIRISNLRKLWLTCSCMLSFSFNRY
ncbi:MAG: phytoene/squalene synthase family protein [Saprospiraceae bacterium]|nr:MAG: phytoene/squalene synthase family protein [Saprospiraceae bacterium]